jgi:hypothetical protein
MVQIVPEHHALIAELSFFLINSEVLQYDVELRIYRFDEIVVIFPDLYATGIIGTPAIYRSICEQPSYGPRAKVEQDMRLRGCRIGDDHASGAPHLSRGTHLRPALR